MSRPGLRPATLSLRRRLAKRAAALALAAAVLVPAAPAAAQEPLTERDLVIYQTAFQAVDAGAWDVARRVSGTASEPALAKVVDWLDLTREDTDATFEEFVSFLTANPGWPSFTTLRRRAELAMPDALSDEQVVNWFRTFEPVSLRGTLRYLGALERLDLEDEAERFARRIWGEISLTPAGQREFLAEHGHLLREEDHLARLDALLWAGREAEARLMEPLVDSGHRALMDARLRLANQSGGVDAAVARVPSELANDPGLIYERVRWRRREGMIESASQLLLLQPPVTAHADRWWEERHILARHMMNNGNYGGAYTLASGHGQTSGLGLLEAEWLAGWLALRFLDEPADAFAHFQAVYNSAETPISRSRGAFWSARALAAAGDEDGAQRWYTTASQYSTAFYGQLAADELGLPTITALPPDPAQSPAAISEFESNEFVRIVRGLDQLGQRSRAEFFLRHIVERADRPAHLALAGRLALSFGRPDLAIRIAKRAAQTGVLLTDAGYPLRELTTVADDIEPALVLALIRRESEFAPDVVSSAGARGLMQLMPATAEEVARRLKVNSSTARLTEDPDHNVLLGSSYMAGLVGQFDGSYLLAAAAYNAGASRVRSWVEAFGDPRTGAIDPVDWIESIPFSETRNYVQRVLEDTQVYRARLGLPPRVGALSQDMTG